MSPAVAWQQHPLIPTCLLCWVESFTCGDWYWLLLKSPCGTCQSDLTTMLTSYSSGIRNGDDAHSVLHPVTPRLLAPFAREKSLSPAVSEPTQHLPASLVHRAAAQ